MNCNKRWNEFSKALEYIYFGDTCDGNDDNEFCKINIVF